MQDVSPDRSYLLEMHAMKISISSEHLLLFLYNVIKKYFVFQLPEFRMSLPFFFWNGRSMSEKENLAFSFHSL